MTNHLVTNHLVTNHQVTNHLVTNHLVTNHLVTNHQVTNHLVTNHQVTNHLVTNHLGGQAGFHAEALLRAALWLLLREDESERQAEERGSVCTLTTAAVNNGCDEQG